MTHVRRVLAIRQAASYFGDVGVDSEIAGRSALSVLASIGYECAETVTSQTVRDPLRLSSSQEQEPEEDRADGRDNQRRWLGVSHGVFKG